MIASLIDSTLKYCSSKVVKICRSCWYSIRLKLENIKFRHATVNLSRGLPLSSLRFLPLPYNAKGRRTLAVISTTNAVAAGCYMRHRHLPYKNAKIKGTPAATRRGRRGERRKPLDVVRESSSGSSITIIST
jgi:hypothetical protein